jgi:hypothetical protein
VKHRVSHDLDDSAARQACDAAIDAYKSRFPDFSPEATWTDDKCAEVRFSAKGVTLKGSIELVPGAVLLDLDVPMVFRFLKKKAIAVIEEEIQEWVKKARTGDL